MNRRGQGRTRSMRLLRSEDGEGWYAVLRGAACTLRLLSELVLAPVRVVIALLRFFVRCGVIIARMAVMTIYGVLGLVVVGNLVFGLGRVLLYPLVR